MEQSLLKGIDHVFNVPMLLGMLAGGYSYRLFRAVGTKLLFPNTTRQLFSLEILSRRAVVETTALLGDTAVFTETLRGTKVALGDSADWSQIARNTEYLGALSLLGSLRVFGSASQAFGGWGREMGMFSQTTADRIIPFLGLYGGILGSQRLNQKLNLPSPNPGSSEYLTALMTLVHFKAAASMVHYLRPQSFKDWEKDARGYMVEARMPKIPPAQLERMIRRFEADRIRSEMNFPKTPSINPDPLLDRVRQNYSYEVTALGPRFPRGGIVVFSQSVELDGRVFSAIAGHQYRVMKVTEEGELVLKSPGGETLALKSAAASPEIPFFSEGDHVVFIPRKGG